MALEHMSIGPDICKANCVNACLMQVWILAAQFEIRQLQLTSARKILGTGVGMCPKARLFKEYIALELQLGNIDRYAARWLCAGRQLVFETCKLAQPSLIKQLSSQVSGVVQKVLGEFSIQLWCVVQVCGDGGLAWRSGARERHI